MNFLRNINEFKFNKKILLLIIWIFFSVTGGTYAYLSASGVDDNTVTGNMSQVDMDLNVKKILPESPVATEILLFQFDELAENLNEGCINEEGDYSLCQLYEIKLKNNVNSINAKVDGSVSFNNESMPNLAWILLEDDYDSSINYTTDMFGDSFNTASLEYKDFVSNYFLKSGDEITFYLLVWLNEIKEIQQDSGSYTGVVKFEDSNGYGITAEFNS